MSKKNNFKKIRKIMKYTIFDNLLYFFSGKNLVYENLIFNFRLFLKRLNYVSDLDPIVIGGCPRSGTTLARSMIGTHPEIASVKKEYNLLLGINDKKDIKTMFKFSNKEIKDIFFKNQDFVKLTENILKKHIKNQNKNFILIKHPHHITIIDKLFRYFPKMKFIHVIRDGRDAVCSLKTHPKRKIISGKMVKLNTKNPFPWCVRRWVVSVKKGKKYRSKKNYMEIKYEDLINNPVESIKKVYKFLNLEMIKDEKIFNFYKSERDKDHPSNIEVGKKLYNRSVHRWKENMSSKEKKIFKKMAGELLIELGYEKDFSW